MPRRTGWTRRRGDIFSKALWLDLRDVMSNTGKVGLHLACLGETWQAAVFGFAGLHLADGRARPRSRLPAHWRAMEFKFHFQGKKYSPA